MQKQTDIYSTIKEFSESIASANDINILLDTLVKLFSKALNAKTCIIRIVEEDELKVKAYHSINNGVVHILNQKIGEDIPYHCISCGENTLIKDTSLLSNELRIIQLFVKTLICCPIRSLNCIIGTIELYDKNAYREDDKHPQFNEQDLSLMDVLCNYATLSIERAIAINNEKEQQIKTQKTISRMDIFFNSIKSAALTIKKDYTITSANKIINHWVNINHTEMLGRKCSEIFQNEIGALIISAAQKSFDSRDITIETFSSMGRHADITAYPILEEKTPLKGKIDECIILIRDITQRIDQQNEIIDLYKRVTQTKDRLESLIENSVDAIVTTDLNGLVTSWNRSAQIIFGHRSDEIVGKFIPFLSGFNQKNGNNYADLIRKGQTLKHIETMGATKDGKYVPISITVSPIKDAYGKINGISIISRDISLRKSVEEKLLKSNQKLSRLFFINSAMRGTLQLDKLLRMILTVVTVGNGLGFNRAILFLLNEDQKTLKGVMGVGAENSEDANRIWRELYLEKKTLSDFMDEIDKGIAKSNSFLNKLSVNIEIPIESECYLTKAIKEQSLFNVKDAKTDALSNPILVQQLGTEAYAAVPLISRNTVTGVLWADNLFSKRTITTEDMEFLSSFAAQVSNAIENARLFEKAKLAEAELQNIFESIYDLVFITDKDYTIIKANKAVAELLGQNIENLVGHKCHDIFKCKDTTHWNNCPHKTTMETLKASITEVEGFYHLNSTETYTLSTSPIFDPYGNFSGTVHIVSKITEMKKLREQLAKIEKVAALGEMAARVAHEIRNPLVSIGGFARRLQKKLDVPLNEYAGIIVSEVGRLEALLKQTIGFVRQSKMSKETIDVNSLLLSVIKLMQSEISKDIIIEYHFACDNIEIIGDPLRLKKRSSTLSTTLKTL
ncbi:PAS/PAC sensor signal transduction histidine kinase [Candidatus Magnetoovum chiemensis]|nr:PAS/PAC sensor signal transduction histidine kinase [Candidatus Magnetoovum chiemensis]